MHSAPQRPRERLMMYGGEQSSVEELVAVILGSGTPGRPVTRIAADLLSVCGGLPGIARATPQELAAVAGIGRARAARLIAAFHLGRRALAATAAASDQLNCAEQVFQLLRPRMDGLLQEVFVVLALDVRNAVIADLEIARGHLSGVDVHPREVFRPLIRQAAATTIVAHNHPSGDPRPSPEDLALTERLRGVGELVGIPLLDHVILAGGRYVSLAERGWE